MRSIVTGTLIIFSTACKVGTPRKCFDASKVVCTKEIEVKNPDCLASTGTQKETKNAAVIIVPHIPAINAATAAARRRRLKESCKAHPTIMRCVEWKVSE